MSKSIQRVCIVGGTHGNELTGVYLVKKFQQYPNLLEQYSFETLTLLANPHAIAFNRRYIDTDLNRCFLHQDLANPMLVQYEQLLAKKIFHQIQDAQINFLIDIHSTTANMGLTLILSNNHPFLCQFAAYLVSINPLVKVFYQDLIKEKRYLRNIDDLGLTLEVGLIANNILDASLFQQTEALIFRILDYLEKYNREPHLSAQTLTVYQYLKTVDYPRNKNNEIQAMIHPHLQGKDYQPLQTGEPLFLTFDGKTIFYEEKATVYPVFINEAAYYEKGIAMHLTQKKEVFL